MRIGRVSRDNRRGSRRPWDVRLGRAFLVQFHRADLRGEGRTRTPRNHDGGDECADFAQDRNPDEIDRQHVCAEARECVAMTTPTTTSQPRVLSYDVFVNEPPPQDGVLPNREPKRFSPTASTLIYGADDAVLTDPGRGHRAGEPLHARRA